MTPLELVYLQQQTSQALSAKYGPIRLLSEVELLPDDPPLFHYRSYPMIYTESKAGELVCAGTSFFSREEAQVKALLEALERYSARHIQPQLHSKVASYRELESLGIRAFGPKEFQFFHQNQFKSPHMWLKPWLEDSKIAWMQAEDTISGAPILIPAGYAYLGPKMKGDEAVHFFSTTSGNALHTSVDKAVSSALMELIERDAFMYSWWTYCPTRKINWLNCDHHKLIAAKRAFSGFEDRIEVGLAATDLPVPVVICRLRGQNSKNEPAVVFSACANLNLIDAMERALTELAQIYISVRGWLKTALSKNWVRSFDDSVRSFADHAHFYALDQHANKTDFLFSDSAMTEVSDLETEFKNFGIHSTSDLIRHMADSGFDVATADLTSRDVRYLGFEVVKVVVPKLLEMEALHMARFWGKPRLFDLSKKLKRHSYPKDVFELNPLPHPFP